MDMASKVRAGLTLTSLTREKGQREASVPGNSAREGGRKGEVRR